MNTVKHLNNNKFQNNFSIFKNDESEELKSIIINNKIYFDSSDVSRLFGYSKNRSNSDMVKKYCDDKDCFILNSNFKDVIDYRLLGRRGGVLINIKGLKSFYKNCFNNDKKIRSYKWINDFVIPNMKNKILENSNINNNKTKNTDSNNDSNIIDNRIDNIIDTIVNNDTFLNKVKDKIKDEIGNEKNNKINDEENNYNIKNNLNSVSINCINKNIVKDDEDYIMIKDFASILNNKVNIKNSNRVSVYKWLRNNGYLYNNNDLKNMPTEKANGLIKVKKHVHKFNCLSYRVDYVPVITKNGLDFFLKEFDKIKAI